MAMVELCITVESFDSTVMSRLSGLIFQWIARQLQVDRQAGTCGQADRTLKTESDSMNSIIKPEIISIEVMRSKNWTP